MAKEILVCNSVFTSDNGAVQAVACRLRGETNGKTFKVAPHVFKGNIPLPGEAIYADFDKTNVRESGNYRILSNAKILSVGVPPEHVDNPADEPKLDADGNPLPF